ncbi:dTDP-glucose 4,6-dehydratase [Caldisalinibacter kiritimatiensis]|uniref:dTDP-glucose 4,6-dehydratase n=1 Tax=Caldisalinibacter kiritimatiensis TaxID=1304284 RepID=R1CVZ9_9FIRM|nr:dTDP-glucose 4,6-dehydratase [Caldisalinibacter kiritimatiensis]EOD00819.1 dTDP-glucose 4,6-dehydratase [Caldisalinibacter kiritimatiensis]
MTRLLITGGAGFIGSNFIKYLFKNNNDISIINVDKLTYAGNLKNLEEIKNNDNYTFIKEDICNKTSMKYIINFYKPNYIINFAAESHVDRSIESSEEFIKTNVLGIQALLECSLNSKINRFIQISTDEVYGSNETGFFNEKSVLKPNNPYAASKASADLLVQSFHNTYGLPTIITRSSNNYGPHQHNEKLIPKVITNCLYRRKIPIYGDGTNIRDWIYVMDNCDAIYKVLNKGASGEVYNISSNNEKRNIDIVRIIIKKTKEILQTRGLDINGVSEDLIEFVTNRKGHDKRYGIDSSKLKDTLGWNPIIQFESGIEKTIEWYIDKELK